MKIAALECQGRAIHTEFYAHVPHFHIQPRFLPDPTKSSEYGTVKDLVSLANQALARLKVQ